MRERIPEFCYTRKDFVLNWYSGTGAGGQHRNKHQNCLRLTHIASGITVSAADNRDRASNLRNAFLRLKPKLEAWIRAQIGEKTYPRSNELVRTYHVADNRVVDHASGAEQPWSDLDMDDMITSRARAGASSKQSGRT